MRKSFERKVGCETFPCKCFTYYWYLRDKKRRVEPSDFPVNCRPCILKNEEVNNLGY